MAWLHTVVVLVPLLLAGAAIAYGGLALVAVWRWRPRRPLPAAGRQPALTVLKPLCGLEPGLYENLRSFCRQDYPRFQLVFGLQDSSDPAQHVVERLRREFPHLDLQLIIDERQHGSNRKVGNLINMLPAARHEHLVIADSDIRVGPDYLCRLAGPLSDPGVGLVTCLYRARPLGSGWAQLGAQFINDWFLPSVLVAQLCGARTFGFGATLALRRNVLVRGGGFESLASQLADDYLLSVRSQALGLRTALADCVVETQVAEARLADLLHHELRWLRTIRTVQPAGYAGVVVTFTMPLSLLALPAATYHPALAAIPLLALLLRIMLNWAVAHKLRLPIQTSVWLIPLRDLLSLTLWIASFCSRRVRWQRQSFSICSDGRMRLP